MLPWREVWKDGARAILKITLRNALAPTESVSWIVAEYVPWRADGAPLKVPLTGSTDIPFGRLPAATDHE